MTNWVRFGLIKNWIGFELIKNWIGFGLIKNWVGFVFGVLEIGGEKRRRSNWKLTWSEKTLKQIEIQKTEAAEREDFAVAAYCKKMSDILNKQKSQIVEKQQLELKIKEEQQRQQKQEVERQKQLIVTLWK